MPMLWIKIFPFIFLLQCLRDLTNHKIIITNLFHTAINKKITQMRKGAGNLCMRLLFFIVTVKLKGFCLSFLSDFHLDIDCNVLTAHFRSSSGNSVNLAINILVRIMKQMINKTIFTHQPQSKISFMMVTRNIYGMSVSPPGGKSQSYIT